MEKEIKSNEKANESAVTNEECGEQCEVFSRVVGYFRPVKNWNDGKQQEFKERKVFKEENSMSHDLKGC